MTPEITQTVFFANVAAQSLLLIGAIWCIALPSRRVYPMTEKTLWLHAMWALFYFAFVSSAALMALDWNSGPWTSWHRFLLGVPVAALGGAFVTWGIVTLGTKNTSGVRDGFVARGPYVISRNPQYVGDIALFAGMTVIANSELVLVSHALTSLVFVLAPLAEEPWLVEQYGEEYVEYRRATSRFL